MLYYIVSYVIVHIYVKFYSRAFQVVMYVLSMFFNDMDRKLEVSACEKFYYICFFVNWPSFPQLLSVGPWKL